LKTGSQKAENQIMITAKTIQPFLSLDVEEEEEEEEEPTEENDVIKDDEDDDDFEEDLDDLEGEE